MRPATRRSLIGAFVVLSVVGLLRSCGQVDEMQATTLGTAPWGYGAVYELAARLWPDTRRVKGTDVRPDGVVWWLPRGAACAERSPVGEVPWPLAGWVRAGGTAVIPLPGPGAGVCALGRDLSLPDRTAGQVPAPAADHGATVDGAGLVARARELAALPRVFRALPADWQVRVRANGGPFVIERPDGAGRLVVIADASFLTNDGLGRDDAALLAADLMAGFGPPAFDDGTAERTSAGALDYVLRSPAALPLVALACLGLLVAWHGMLVPARPPAADGPPAPRLDDFVRSLGRLHRRSGDWRGLLARQRAWAAAALAPRLGLPEHAPPDIVLDRLRTVHGDACAAPFVDDAPIADARELERRLAEVAAVVEEVAR